MNRGPVALQGGPIWGNRLLSEFTWFTLATSIQTLPTFAMPHGSPLTRQWIVLQTVASRRYSPESAPELSDRPAECWCGVRGVGPPLASVHGEHDDVGRRPESTDSQGTDGARQFSDDRSIHG